MAIAKPIKKKTKAPTKAPIKKQAAATVPRTKRYRKYQTLRGFKDTLTSEQPFWKAVRDQVERLANDYSYQYVQTPIIEQAGLFKRTIGDSTDVISKEISRLPGMDIFSHKEDTCTIKNITDDSPKALQNMLRRVFLLTIETMNDLNEGFETNNKHILESIQMKHDNITKFYAYSR